MTRKNIFLTAALVFALGATGVAAANAFHFALRSSVPAADATVAPPEEVRLVFTEAPQANSVGIRLIDAAGEAVPTTEPAADPNDAAQMFVKPSAALSAGSYTVSWRGIGDDGHAVTGNFGFSVSAQ
jgi:methionine-rich copper-binding protein CopC